MSDRGLLIALIIIACLIGYNSNAGAGVLFLVGSLIYFIPSMVALHRGHHNSNAIFATNLLAGWSLVGWVIAMVWALTVVQPSMSVGPIEFTPSPRPLPPEVSPTALAPGEQPQSQQPQTSGKDERHQPRFALPLKIAAAGVGIAAIVFVVASMRNAAPEEKAAREHVTTPVNTAKTSTVAGTIEDADAAFNRGDYTTAIKLYRPLADNGNPKAQLNVGLMYIEGRAVIKDSNIAQAWFKRAADNPASDRATREAAISNRDYVAGRLAK